jgi:hypothetical protein
MKPAPPLFHVGDWVRLLHAWCGAIGEVLEDRGNLGARGERFYTVRIKLDDWNEMTSEFPEDSLEAVAPRHSSDRQRPAIDDCSATTPFGNEGSMSEKLGAIKAIGFTVAGCWTQTNTGLAFELNDLANARNVLYAFVVDDELMYLGKTVQSLRTRMAGYKTPGPTQSTNVRNNLKIRKILAQGKRVQILVLPDNGLLHYGGFHVNLAAGLEDSLVRKLTPPWNGGKKEAPNQLLQPTEPAS